MDRPPARPEGALIRLARQAAGLTIPEAVRLSGVSKARWSTVESGHETRDGEVKQVNAKADTIARMARAVGLTPERLASEGQRADAAEILREILSRAGDDPGTAQPRRPEPPTAAETARVLFPGDETLRAAWELPNLDEGERARLVRFIREELRGERSPSEGRGAAG